MSGDGSSETSDCLASAGRWAPVGSVAALMVESPLGSGPSGVGQLRGESLAP
jgi:hypothetical protein